MQLALLRKGKRITKKKAQPGGWTFFNTYENNIKLFFP